jgi:hypothetical protein
MVLCLLALVVVYGGGWLLDSLYLGPARDLAQAVAAAEERVSRQRLLLSRAEQIEARYRELDAPAVAAADSAWTENAVLRELSELAAGRQVHVKSVVPRLGHHDGVPVMFVALDCEGPFAAVASYLDRILVEIPSEISNLSLAPQPEDAGGVVCRLSIRVGGLGTSTGS